MKNDHRYSLASHTFRPVVNPPDPPPPDAYWFAFSDHQLLVTTQENGGATGPVSGDPDATGAMVPWAPSLHSLGLAPLRTQYLGTVDDQPCYSAELPAGAQPPPGLKLVDLRRLYGLLDEDFFWIAGRAVQIVDWDRTHQYCSACATPLDYRPNERVKLCPACGHSSYPRLAPAVIFAVIRGEQPRERRILLARAHYHPPGRFSVLAGFVEPGETLEECLRREVKEEVGIEVKNIRYFGSQPWPFPHSLMIAFTCEYAGGELVLEEQEIAEAGWFTADNLPRIPPRISISRALIDWFVEQQRGGDTLEKRDRRLGG